MLEKQELRRTPTGFDEACMNLEAAHASLHEPHTKLHGRSLPVHDFEADGYGLSGPCLTEWRVPEHGRLTDVNGSPAPRVKRTCQQNEPILAGSRGDETNPFPAVSPDQLPPAALFRLTPRPPPPNIAPGIPLQSLRRHGLVRSDTHFVGPHPLPSCHTPWPSAVPASRSPFIAPERPPFALPAPGCPLHAPASHGD